MKRRGFLKFLGLLPFAPALAEAAAKTIKNNYTGMDLAIKGSDQTSIWIFGPMPGRETLLDFANRYKDDSRILPVVETLSQRNPLLQDMVWREGSLKPGHRFTRGGKYPHISFKRKS